MTIKSEAGSFPGRNRFKEAEEADEADEVEEG